MKKKHLLLGKAVIILSVSFLMITCGVRRTESVRLVEIAATGTNNHRAADEVFLSVVFDRNTNLIVAINYDPLAPENNTSDTRTENVGREGVDNYGVPQYMRYLIPWRENRDLVISQLIGMNALVLAEMDNISAIRANTVTEIDGVSVDAVSGATMTRNSFINAVIEASRLFRDLD